ncbi:MAG: hypothetical protein WCT08_06610 [Patescibacteria group bacterium]|jgi:hypothetical protein
MKNLAGNQDCDLQIENELLRSGIQGMRVDRVGDEVPYSLTGQLGGFSFTRAWSYWRVKGLLPLEVAQELYADPIGKTDIRIEGNGGCPPPEKPWVKWLTSAGKEIIPTDQKAGYDSLIQKNLLSAEVLDKYIFSDDLASVGAKPYIIGYHIDSEAGLRLFADTLKKHGLV